MAERRDIFNEINSNKLKTVFLFIGFFAFIFLLAIAIKYIFNFTGFGILFIAGVIAIVYAIIGYFLGDKIVLATSGAKEADEKKHVYLINLVEGLSLSAGIPKPKVYVIEDKSPNAFATGRNPRHSSIAVTTGLLEMMNRQELEGVIAHEMSHIQNRDIQVMTFVSVLFGIVSITSDIALRGMIYGGSGDRDNKNIPLLILAIVLVILAPLIAFIIQMALSRNREYLADSSAGKLTRYPQGLASALRKISGFNQPVKNASKGTAHLYIANPLSSGGLSNLFSTHPPIQERIKRLEAM
ncbi:MAG TPA: M48 family metalloprotease [Candidatus Diapherotrites archaeon]|nr:M48 family metalloprotease [Candidatus Diapherotrites archaeon]